jgi:hypothetical protein
VRPVILVVLVAAAIQHLSHTAPVREWQARQAARQACTVVIVNAREDLFERYCQAA